MGKAFGQALLELAIPAVIAAFVTFVIGPQPEGGWSMVLAATTFFAVFGSVAFLTNQ